MENTIFEGDISQISDVQLKFIRDVLNKQGFNGAKVTINAVGEAADNYVAEVKRVTAEKNGKTFKMIAKVAPNLEQLRMQMNTHLLFKNEEIMYTKVLPRFTELEVEAGIPEEERLRYAACYGCLLDEPNELVLLEDLQVSGFVILDRFKSLTDENVRLVLKNFAKLHALSYVLKNREPETFDSYKQALFDAWEKMSQDEMAKIYFTALEDDAISLLDTQRYKNAIKGTVSDIGKIICKNLAVDKDSRYSVIQQGDSWTNNLMFKIEDGTPSSLCMIDYQLSKVNSPVADLHYMIFNCTDYKTRAKYYHEWIDYYHSELDNRLSEFGLKASFIYPRDQLDADLKRHGISCLAFTVVLASGLIVKNEEAAKFKETMKNVGDDFEKVLGASKMSGLDEETKYLFRSRIEGGIDTLTELGYI